MLDAVKYDDCAALFRRYDIELSESAYITFSEYLELLRSAGQNLTAVREPDQIWIRHFLDSAFISRYIGRDSSLLDIGTGGGIPAIPLAILRHDLHISMLDSENSKIEFCREVIQTLHLNCQAICARAEELAHDVSYRENYDYAVSRAMSQGSMLSELALPFVKPGGSLIAMKGRSFDDSIERFTEAAEALGAERPEYISYEIENERKTVVITRKSVETPAIFPRRYAKIKRNPL